MANYSVLTQIIVQQVTPYTPPGKPSIERNRRFVIPYLISYSGDGFSWENLCQNMNIVLPKNIKFKDQSGQVYSLGSINGKPSSIGGYVGAPTTDITPAIPGLTTPLVSAPEVIPIPTFMRGDMITLNVGYRTKLFANGGSEVTYMTGGQDPTGVYPNNLTLANPGVPPLFQGFISKVSPKLPFTLECEDAMWLMGLVPTISKQWNNSNLPEIFNSIINTAYANPDSLLNRYKKYGVVITLSDYSKTDLVFNVSNFITTRGDLRGMLGRMKHQYQVNSYFLGYELRLGMTCYIASEAKTQSFAFQKNILDDDKLSFKRKDDTPLSVIVTAYYGVETGNTTKDGQKIIKAQKTQILVFNQAGEFVKIDGKRGVEFPANDVGKRFQLKRHTPETDVNVLFQWGVRYLKKYYYDGLQGSFTTFAIPFVKHGDVINLTNPILPEMDGLYMVKSVSPYGSVGEGFFQTIELDYKINQFSDIGAFDS